MQLGVGRIMGIGRWGVILGVLIISMSILLTQPVGAWIGLGLALLSLTLNTAGKFNHYAHLDIPPSHRIQVMSAWGFLVTTIGGLMTDYVYGLTNPAYEGFFWPLVIAAAGFGAIYWGLRKRYVPNIKIAES